MTPLVNRLLFSAVLCVYCIAGILYATATPPWQTPDEPAHYNYVKYLAANANFPQLTAPCYDQEYLNLLTAQKFRPGLSIATVCYEYHQPPLYYLIIEPIFVLSSGALQAMRLAGVALGAGVVVLAYFVSSTVFPGQPLIPLGAMAFVAFVPMHVAMLASVNNDALAGLIFAAILLLLLRRIRQATPATLLQNLLLGLLLGIALITKVTIYIAVPLVALGVVLTARRDGFSWQKMLPPVVVIFGVALLLAAPWYWRNAALYGGADILGLGRHNEVVVGQLRTSELVSDVGLVGYARSFGVTTFNSFWGQFGWMAVPMDGRTYRLLALLSLLAGVGLALFVAGQLRREHQPALSRPQWEMLTLLAASALLSGLAYGWYNLSFVQFQGRYLFTAIVPLGLFFAVGLDTMLQPRWSWLLAAILALALLWLAGASLWQGGLDKWAVLLTGSLLALALGQIFLPRYQPILSGLLRAGWYGGLALLVLLSPGWFIVPYL